MARGAAGNENVGATGLDAVTFPALAALWEAMIAAHERTGDDRDLRLQPYIAARRHPTTRRLVILAEGVCRALIRYVTGKGTTEAAEHAVALLAAELGLGPSVAAREEWDIGAAPAAAMLREIAVDEFALVFEVVLPPRRAGLPEIALVWHPADPAGTRSTLLRRVLQDALAAMAVDPLVRLEHRAAAWWFDCWTPRLPGDPDRALDAALARELRRAEWCVAGRLTVAHGASIVESFLSRTRADEPSPLRREIARALGGSVASLFVVRARMDERSVLEESISGAAIHVSDHRPETAYPPGSFALGRVLQLDDGTCARSPGMTFFVHEDAKVMEAVKAEFLARVPVLGPEIAIEGILAIASGDRAVPREVPPATSPQEAQRLMDDAWRLLRHRLGGRKVRPPRDSPRERLAAIEAGDAEAREFMLDRCMSEWIHALNVQAHDSPGAGPSG